MQPSPSALTEVETWPDTSPETRKRLILVVDEHQAVLDEAATALASARFACHCCTTAEAAVAAAESMRPDLIIFDVNLRGHSGLQLCEQIKQNAALADVPVMFLSGTQIPDIIRRSDVVGSSYHLRKPFDPEVLLELVDQALAKPVMCCGGAAV